MYTAQHRQRVIGGECTHLISGGSEECPTVASKYWVFLEEGPEMRLQIVVVVPVCREHAQSMRAMMNSKNSWLNRDDWELIDRDSSSFYLIEESLD